MTDQSMPLPRFFVTTEAPCPYLPGRMERKIFTELRGPNAQQLNESLGRIGFRRSQNVAYRPNCRGCRACISVRVATRDFLPTTSQRRVLRQHADLDVAACDPWATEEQYALLRAYLHDRHPGGGMVKMDGYDFAEMIESSPVDTLVVEYREKNADGTLGRLVGTCLTDKQSDGLSMVYSFYAVGKKERKSLGTFIILDHIMRAKKVGMPYVYLGYWVKGSQHMDYKRRFQPLEMLTENGWERMTPDNSRQAKAPSYGDLD